MTTLDYANTMLDIYLNDDDWQPEAIQHYLELRMSEMVKIDRERELERLELTWWRKMTIHFDAELRQIRSMADHTFNVIINVPEYNIEHVQQMMTMLGDMVAVAMVKADINDSDY